MSKPCRAGSAALPFTLTASATAVALALATGSARAADAAAVESIVVTATRTEARAFDVPAAIDRIGADEIRNARAGVNISESLGAVPGLLARDRQNYAQDVQISVRGFGARASFGIRGVRLYVDGIPATLPDGQGQISNVELGSVERIEVLRGPYSALYGNSSGGVLQVFTEEGSGPPRASLSMASGSDGLQRVGVQASGRVGRLAYTGSASRFVTDGWRDHSATTRWLGNGKLAWFIDDASKLTLVVNSVALPQAQDPLGLTRAQFEANPRGVDPSALSFDTRKTVNQSQLGAVYERRLAAGVGLQFSSYGGHRNTEQFQSIPVATQASALHPGGVISLGRDYRGADLRVNAATDLAGVPLSVVAGLSHDALQERRRGYQNFVGSVLGVKGALRRDEFNDVSATDPYVQASLQFGPQWRLNAGVRHSRIAFGSRDNYIAGSNPDDSGSATYSATLPAVGLMFAASEQWHLYASAGRGFETPTLNELSYRPGGATGLNFGLRPARSTSTEVGIKARPAGLGEFNAASFNTATEDEIVTLSNTGGRATFQNAGATRRQGLEFAWRQRLLGDLRLQAAYTLLNATYRDGFSTCTAAPCAAPNVAVAAGKRIPGLARQVAVLGLNWTPPQGLRGGIEWRRVGAVFVNDINSDAAPGAATASVSLGYVLQAGPFELNAFVRVDNVQDRAVIGSVIVNEGNGRYFEPAPGRSMLAGLTLSAAF